MANKWVVKLEGVISSVIITMIRVFTIVDFPCGIGKKMGFT
jgi:hypothetical protein